MNERIKKIRETLDMSRAAFGERLGISGDVVNNLERGRIEIRDDRIKLICREYDVNEDWLRTGEGEMFIKKDREDELMEWVGQTLGSESETFQKRFVRMLSKLSVSDWEVLERMALALAEDKKEPGD